ncbi:hypothetical protein GCM10020221_22680 [Streptomyces thioluteus]|uniref:Uncharacterized protein n=1 Tax=Streptomyces thioluteus TaxID=66431 RepID=A0ABN3WUR4_STRTU
MAQLGALEAVEDLSRALGSMEPGFTSAEADYAAPASALAKRGDLSEARKQAQTASELATL